MIVPRLPGAGLLDSCQPLTASGVGWFDANDLGLPPFTVIPAAPGRIDSNPLSVAGFNAFVLVIAIDPPDVNVFVSHCDPASGAILLAQSIGVLVVGGSPLIVTFGAFSTNFLTGDDWNVIRIGFQGVLAASNVFPSVATPALFCGTR